ncbi:MAG TPA: flagellar type III secretion system pore protein FliP [Bacillota bacterium]|nr:flagellar type III secretion system pore protein FliP [Bacillota bacterium]
MPSVQVTLGQAGNPAQVASTVQIMLLLTVLAVAPAILILMTSFTRIIVVLSFVRSALATGTMPPNQVLVGLALFLTLFVMKGPLGQVYSQAWVPYQAGQITLQQAIDDAQSPLRGFMLAQTRPSDLALFVDMQGSKPAKPQDVSFTALVPAFTISELKTAFEMGFVIFIPFVVIDMVVASTLMSMGMMLLPPVMISLPFKVLLFVLVDGWHLTMQSLLLSFH